MAHLMQLRIPKGTDLKTAIQDMADAGWNDISEFFESHDGAVKSYQRDFLEQISLSIESYLTTYTRCGSSALCSDEVEGAPWLNYDDEIFLLQLTEGLPVVVDNLAFAGLHSVIDILKPVSRKKVFSRLHKTFTKKLNSYLYYNPVCRKIEFCDKSTPASIWRH